MLKAIAVLHDPSETAASASVVTAAANDDLLRDEAKVVAPAVEGPHVEVKVALKWNEAFAKFEHRNDTFKL
jgi:hypothetical protein